MNNKKTVLFIIFSILLVSSFISAVSIKERMIKRKPGIDALKNQEILGENNLGFLVFRIPAQTNKQKTIVNRENQDRNIIYAKIAKKNNVNPKDVGKLRARNIARSAPKGHWLQNPKGKWYRKK